MNKKQTAVDFLVDKIVIADIKGFSLQMSKLQEWAKQAIEMEKQQIVDAYVNKELFINNPLKENESVSRVFKEIKLAEEYYKETYELS